MKKLLTSITKDLKNNIDITFRKKQQTFFKEPIISFGVRRSIIKDIANIYFYKIKDNHKQEMLSLCTLLFKQKEMEYFFIASHWLNKIKKTFEPIDFDYFQTCIKKYVSNWATCDDICTNAFGYFIYTFPEHIQIIKETWPQTKNRWIRRAAAVNFIYSVRKNAISLQDIFTITDSLLYDSDDLVQKGYGWLLKVTSKYHEKAIFNYVIKHKNTMPRTALRYAIEKLPHQQKIRALQK